MAKKDDTSAPPATNDAYTGMLAISLFALIGGCVLLYLDFSQYPDSKGPAVPKAPPIVKAGDVPAQAPASSAGPACGGTESAGRSQGCRSAQSGRGTEGMRVGFLAIPSIISLSVFT